MGRQRKTWSPDIKEQIVLTVLRGGQTRKFVAEVTHVQEVWKDIINVAKKRDQDVKRK